MECRAQSDTSSHQKSLYQRVVRIAERIALRQGGLSSDLALDPAPAKYLFPSARIYHPLQLTCTPYFTHGKVEALVDWM
jgi:hypothetical protein